MSYFVLLPATPTAEMLLPLESLMAPVAARELLMEVYASVPQSPEMSLYVLVPAEPNESMLKPLLRTLDSVAAGKLLKDVFSRFQQPSALAKAVTIVGYRCRTSESERWQLEETPVHWEQEPLMLVREHQAQLTEMVGSHLELEQCYEHAQAAIEGSTDRLRQERNELHSQVLVLTDVKVAAAEMLRISGLAVQGSAAYTRAVTNLHNALERVGAKAGACTTGDAA